MALIKSNNLRRSNKERNLVHKEVDASYTTFNSTGEKYFQIDTYGSNDRKFQGKISQSIQFNKETAVDLITILRKEFNI
ncbi:flagellar basal body L-ring protein FlgH [Evansella vedderi]|uniref:Flagellar basal body L-ring protein FlgH n=1 Tax=Evansella vedderi TaxID=38282 RepID=A0ABT9ZQ42_9BACI|nr:hypothetical protein [Evansella vedderi]MDQ0253363.1 flagellar basal body L-ring protein FlgH [Evansella vedderi]